MRAPLLELREKITGFRGSVEAALFALRNGLQQRSDAAAAREVLELLLDTFHVVSKVHDSGFSILIFHFASVILRLLLISLATYSSDYLL